MKACIHIRLACREKPKTFPIGSAIKQGDYIANCRVLFAEPRECIVWTTTRIESVSYVEYRTEELSKNIKIEIRYTKGKEVYVYPKRVWETVLYRYIEPLSSGLPPREPGCLLHGPPGTGKTSMINLLTDILGLRRFKITPDTLLSKWVGESEKKLGLIIKQAESSEPSIVIADDAEWLVKAREGIRGGDDAMVNLTLLSILLDKIPQWKREGKRVTMFVATKRSCEAVGLANLYLFHCLTSRLLELCWRSTA